MAPISDEVNRMNFNLVKGDPSRIPEYCEVFYDSKLSDAYFAEEGVL